MTSDKEEMNVKSLWPPHGSWTVTFSLIKRSFGKGHDPRIGPHFRGNE